MPSFLKAAQEITKQSGASNILEGYRSFKNLHFKLHEQEFLRLVKEGQNPHALFITCSDSRISPDFILQTAPGELFVLRVAGNFVPPFNPQSDDGVTATIQYAIEVLKIKHIIICGHSHCGAIQSLYQELNSETLGNVQNWLKLGLPAKNAVLAHTSATISKEELCYLTEKVSVLVQLQNLLTYPFIQEAVSKDTLALHGWYYTIETGELEYFEPEQDKFLPLKNIL